MANFGVSVGDIITVGSLAWNVYKACSNASSEFQEVAREVVSLHSAVKQLEVEASKPDSIIQRTIDSKKEELNTLVKNIDAVLERLDGLLSKYKSLSTSDRRKRDVLRFGSEGLADVRSKIILHTSATNMFLETLSVASLGRIEVKLDEIVHELRNGKRNTAAIAVSDDEDDPAAAKQWRTLRKELVDDGFQRDDIENHKAWIKAEMRKRIDNGHIRDTSTRSATDVWATGLESTMYGSYYAMSQDDIRPQNLAFRPHPNQVEDQEIDIYSAPKLRRSPSMSSMSSTHSEVAEYDIYGNMTKKTITTTQVIHYSTSQSETSAASDREAPTTGRFHLPPPTQSMMGRFSSKTSSSSQKKHKCKVCDKRFTRPSSLQTHMYSHTGEKPFECEVEGCGRAFSVVGNLRRHRKVHQAEQKKPTSDADSES